MKKLIIIALTCLSTNIFAQSTPFTIDGTFKAKMPAGKVHYSYSDHGTVVKDSTVLIDGKFRFAGIVKGVQKGYFAFKPDKAPNLRSAWLDTKVIFIEGGNFKVLAKDSMTKAQIIGSEINNEFANYMRPINELALARKPIYNEFIKYSAADRTTSPRALELDKQLKESAAKREQILASYVSNHPKSYFSIDAIYELMGPYVEVDKVESLWGALSEELKQSYDGKILNGILTGSRRTDVGSLAPQFIQPDTSGKMVKLNDIKSKYMLIDFWASWCHPCRAENPNVIKAYNRFKEKGFTVVGISLDVEKDRQKWLNAIHEDKLPWMQLISPANINSGARKAYGIRAIPSNFLIDDKGKIVAKNLRGEALEQKLTALFN